MPNNGVNIYFTIKDDGSATLASITDKTKALDKETQQLQQSYVALQKANEGLIRRQTELKKELQLAREEAKEAKKAFDDLGDSASQDAYEKAQRKVEGLRNEISATSKALRENERIYKSNMETVRKGITGEGGTVAGMLSALGKAGLYSMAGEVAGQWANTLVGSAAGSAGGNLFSGLLGGAGAGAAIGSIIPGVGTAVGAGVGALVGLAGGAAQNYEEKDEAFKSYYGGLFENVNQGTEDMISSGSSIAGSREQTQMAFARRFGSEEEAAAYLARVQEMAAKTNYTYDEITGYSKLLLNSYDPEEIFGVLKSLSDASAGLDLNSSDVQMFISGLSRMRTTGKATQEYLNYFTERGVDVYAALGQSLGVDKSQVAGMVSKGQIGGTEAAQAILDFIDQEFGGLSEELSGTYDAVVNNLQDTMANLEAMGGEGYNNVRISGAQAELEAYGGALGEAVGEINRIAGENKAYLENLSEQYTREALSAVLLGEETTLYKGMDAELLEGIRQEYAQAAEDYAAGNQEAGLKMEALKEEAEALATAAYESSDQYLALQDVEMDQIAAIRENTDALNSWKSNYEKTIELSKGLASTSGNREEILSRMPAQWQPALHGQSPYGTSSHAYGLRRVPYDEYPALLHEGERVLTASEARAQDSGGRQVVVNISGNWSVRSDSDVDAIADAIANRLEQAAAAAAPR